MRESYVGVNKSRRQSSSELRDVVALQVFSRKFLIHSSFFSSMNDAKLLEAIYVSATNHAIITMDMQGNVTSWNLGAENILGFKREEMLGKTASIIFTPEDCALSVPQQEFDSACSTGRADDFRWHVRKDGSRFWGEGVVTPLLAASGEQIGFLKIVYDATEKKQVADQLHQMANIDNLTGIPNRACLHSRLTEMMAAMSRSGELLLLQIVDLDYFKQVNDSLGHAVGDQVLRQAAQRMQTILRATDFIARLGGDEFVILQPNAHSPEVGVNLASKIIETLSHPFHIEGNEIHIGASIGIATFPQDASKPENLLKKADLALYRVKADGRGGFCYFTRHLDKEAHNWSRNLSEIKRCTASNAFWLEYQPEIDCATGKIVSLEALLRFQSQTLSSCPLDNVIALAADSGLMPKIGQWVLAEACAQQKRWQGAGLPYMKIAVNFCPNQLMSRSIVKQVEAILHQNSVEPNDLEIEITERQIYSTQRHGLLVLTDLRSLGINVVLDDFGTGYSSLSYLRRLPIDRLKLDREFLRDIPSDPHSDLIAESVINLAHALDIEVIAEGVETKEQVEYCKQKKCDAMQGFYFSRPLPENDITNLLIKQFNVH